MGMEGELGGIYSQGTHSITLRSFKRWRLPIPFPSYDFDSCSEDWRVIMAPSQIDTTSFTGELEKDVVFIGPGGGGVPQTKTDF